MNKTCYHCGFLFSDDYKPGFRDECPKCIRDVHVCKNCVYHDTSLSNECRETQADRVVDKEKGNFCEYFNYKDSLNKNGNISKKNNIDAFNKLFND